MSPRIWIVLGALSAAISVGLGAYHAHGLESALKLRGLDADELSRQLHNYSVGVHYQMIHALALVIVGLLMWHAPTKWFIVTGILFVAGTLLFSGCLYVPVLASVKLPWYLVPSGGLALIVAWIALAVGAMMHPAPK